MATIKYYATNIMGLEDILWQEIQTKLHNISLIEKKKGRISFTYAGDPKELLNIRSAENIYVYVGIISGLTRSRNSLGEIFKQVSSYNLEIPLKIHKDLHGGKGKKRPTFRVVSTMIGRHNFRRIDAQTAVESALTKKYDWKLAIENPTIEFRLDLEEDKAIIGIRLTDERIRRRKYKISHIPGSLNPSVAYSMVFLSEPNSSDIFIDPLCGAGTIAIERAYFGRCDMIIAGDIQQNSIESAKDNIESNRKNINLIQWDVNFLPIRDHSINKVVCNLPFGKQTGSQTENKGLYVSFFKEIRRIMRSQGKCVLLVIDSNLVDSIISNYKNIKLNNRISIDLSGIRAYIYVLNFL
ncbi:MAG: methyltransferase [Candidatus Poribacteria bacterium]